MSTVSTHQGYLNSAKWNLENKIVLNPNKEQTLIHWLFLKKDLTWLIDWWLSNISDQDLTWSETLDIQ